MFFRGNSVWGASIFINGNVNCFKKESVIINFVKYFGHFEIVFGIIFNPTIFGWALPTKVVS